MMRFLTLFLLLSLVGCNKVSSVDKVISAEAIKNANHGNINIINIELQQGKLVKGGQLVSADVIVPESIRPDEVKPTTLGIIKILGNKYPDCEWFHIRVFDSKLMAETSHYLAIAEFKEGALNITGGLPTDTDIAEFNNAKLYPDSLDFSGKTRLYTLRRPSDTDKNIAHKWHLAKLELNRIKTVGNIVHDKDIDNAVAKAMALDVKKVSDSNQAVYHYYMLKVGQPIL